MPEMPHTLTAVRKVIQALESVGFAHVRTKGSHAVYRDREGRVAVIP